MKYAKSSEENVSPRFASPATTSLEETPEVDRNSKPALPTLNLKLISLDYENLKKEMADLRKEKQRLKRENCMYKA